MYEFYGRPTPKGQGRRLPKTSELPSMRGSRPWTERSWATATGVLLLYAALGLAAYRPILPLQGGRIPACACGDPALQTWFLAWVPYAILHGHNPLFSAWTNYPFGVNLAQNTEMPLLGLLASPLTLAVSPIASYNLLLWLAFPTSAGSMFLVLRRWTGSTVAAFIGGLLYGFSAYVVGQGVGHVMLSFVPLPPLFIYQLHKLVVRQCGDPYREGFVLGVIGLAQFFIEPEIVASLAIISTLAILILLASHRRSIRTSVVAYTVRGLAVCAGLVIVVAAYPLWFEVRGPRHFTGPVRSVNNGFHLDLLGPVIPTLSQHFAPGAIHGIGRELGNVENGIYFGIPLLLLIVLLGIRFRRNRWIGFSAAMAMLAFILGLGPRLVVWDHRTSIPLPFALLARLPLMNNLVPARLSLFAIMFAAVLVAVAVSEMITLRRGLTTPDRRRRPIGAVRTAFVVGLGLLAAIALLPRWPYSSSPASVPSFFRSSLVNRIPLDSAVLTYPFPSYPYNEAMMWQAVAEMRFKEVGTYALIPNAKGTATPLPPLLPPAAVQRFLIHQESGQPSLAPHLNLRLVHDLYQYLENYRISTVIAVRSGTYPDQSGAYLVGADNATKLFTEGLGPPEIDGAVAVWFDIPARLGRLG